MESFIDLKEAVMQGAVKRIRPKMMTVTAILVGLLPIMWGHGTGADVMKRIAAPMIGGVITSAILELFIYPAIYTLWKWRWEVRSALVKANLDRIVERLAALPAIDRQQAMEALARPEPYKGVEEGLEKKLGMPAQVLR
jgi:membrane protein YdbS with pleckstrin-like domain